MRLDRERPIPPWIENNFELRCPISTVEQYINLVGERMNEMPRLPEVALELRQNVRESFGIKPDTAWIVLGEQSVGLNEPPLVIGKRVLGAFLASKGSSCLHYYAESDVVNSEPGLYRLELPDPTNQEGIRRIHWLSSDKFNQVPANRVSLDEINIERVIDELAKIYDRHSLRFRAFLGDLVQETSPLFSPAQNYAEMMNHLQGRLLSELGLLSRKKTSDVDFDSMLAKEGGLDLVLQLWPTIVDLSNKYKKLWDRVRIPEKNEAPFYVYLSGCPIRAKVFFDEEKDGYFIAVHPFRREFLRSFNKDQIMDGEIPITFRAIPRVLLFSSIFDGHVTGGGAGYNKITREVFKEIFGIDYFPLTWMDLVDENNQLLGLFQYQSLALRRKRREGYSIAEEMVRRGLVSALDLYLSLPPNAKEAVQQQVFENPNFNMATRVYLD